MSSSITYRGRYSEPVPTSNLVNDDEDFPEFEAFEDEDATPRAHYSASSLEVLQVEMCQKINKPNHFTYSYDLQNLVIRRGQEFMIRVSFNRIPGPSDDFQIEFLIGANPTLIKGSLVKVVFGPRAGGGGRWQGQVLEAQGGGALMIGITPAADAIVGKYRMYVAVSHGWGMQRTRRDATTDLYMLFNAWCTEDAVFLSNEAERQEYVLADYGTIYQGSVGSVGHRDWVYGQFERGVLDACIFLLDSSRMPIYNRGDCIKLVRKGSAMINSQDDSGVCVGNWSDDFSMGRSPTSWTGSVRILLQYANTGTPVSFAQCWVFAGVFNTFLRALGIPSRVVTNFNSAHDNTGNLKTDLIFKQDGSPDERNTRDSIWNYHCWNEVFMTRLDLPPGLGGWQVVDSTPQETSDGHYRCGPAPVAAIKEGLLCHPYDVAFCFAEVNSDVVFHKRDKYGSLTPYRVEKTYVGRNICTKSVGSSRPYDITHTYKYPEGSAKDEQTMTRAEEYGCVRDHSDVPEIPLVVTITADQVYLGENVVLQVVFQNQDDAPRVIQAQLAGAIVYYTGVRAHRLRDRSFSVTVPANQSVTEVVTVAAEEYIPFLGSQLALYFMVTGQSDGQSVTTMKLVNLKTPELTLMVSGAPQVNQEMFVTVSFTNSFNFPLRNVQLSMEGPGLMSSRSRHYSSIEPGAVITWKDSFFPRLAGPRALVAVMDCSNLRQIWGVTHFVIGA
ncbi:LOW QUALITY PROTEIN: coagulation factor XIII A chain-like [Trematomus bernacchii]|uniref:LOW QUALITY PROTEIN: coagulation factor XIII A chain-like n=1 Tax=Trematomus bernacchii TaxID=40690 RepID=UPI00146A46E2|nr:LOW QUALITY PROTEIN: coagulation factor XIII A chain-like [Trematomus bernacchii]